MINSNIADWKNISKENDKFEAVADMRSHDIHGLLISRHPGYISCFSLIEQIF